MRTLPIALALALTAAFAPAPRLAFADQPGRYSMSPAEGGGFVRLDTQTGAMTLCRSERNELTCKPASGDDIAQRQELDRLRGENKALAAEVRRLEELLLPPVGAGGTGANKGGDGKPPATEGNKPPGFSIPTEQDIDRAMDVLSRMWKRFQERMKEFEPKHQGTPL